MREQPTVVTTFFLYSAFKLKKAGENPRSGPNSSFPRLEPLRDLHLEVAAQGRTETCVVVDRIARERGIFIEHVVDRERQIRFCGQIYAIRKIDGSLRVDRLPVQDRIILE